MQCLKKYNLEYELVPWRPFDPEPVKIKSERKDVWFWGSIDTGIELQKQGWYPGIMYNKNHDFDTYLKKYGDNMLNAEGGVLPFGQTPPWGGPWFIIPTRDTKIFPAKIWDDKEWTDYIQETRENGLVVEISAKTKVMFSTPKDNIQQEIRCWIIDGEPVTMSQYKIGRRVNMLNMDNNEEAYIFAKQMAKIFCPSRVFVLDICLHEDEYKIVEINCANMSGFYDINMCKLIQSLENTFV
jgi:hypothetical protein